MMLMSLKNLHFEKYDGEVNSKLSFFEIWRYSIQLSDMEMWSPAKYPDYG